MLFFHHGVDVSMWGRLYLQGQPLRLLHPYCGYRNLCLIVVVNNGHLFNIKVDHLLSAPTGSVPSDSIFLRQPLSDSPWFYKRVHPTTEYPVFPRWFFSQILSSGTRTPKTPWTFLGSPFHLKSTGAIWEFSHWSVRWNSFVAHHSDLVVF